jgi:signal peptidase I
MIDLGLLSVLQVLILAGAAAAEGTGRASWRVWPAALGVYLVVVVTYFTVLTAGTGQTVGKRVAGVLVETNEGRRIGWGRSLLRAVADLVLLGLTQFLVGYIDPILLAATRRKRALHDMIAGSWARRTDYALSRALPWLAVLGWVAPFVLVFAVVRPFVAQAFFMPSESMHPTIDAHDHLIANKLALRLGGIRRGDVVVFSAPPEALGLPGTPVGDASARVYFTKRVIGVAGDSVKVRRGVGVFVNGKLLKEPYVAQVPNYNYPSGPDESHRVPAGHCFVLGDNRNNSADSHTWGPLPAANVCGKVTVRCWPLQHAGAIR